MFCCGLIHQPANHRCCRVHLRGVGTAWPVIAATLSSLGLVQSLECHADPIDPAKDGSIIPLESFTNLRTLKLVDIIGRLIFERTAPLMIAQSPYLTTLELIPESGLDRQSFEFHTLVQGAILSPQFSPSLENLTISQDKTPLTLHSVPYLRNLTNLRLLDSDSFVPEAFWTELLANGVHLRSLHISRFDQRLVDYLSSYSGLETLDIAQRAYAVRRLKNATELFKQIFHVVLPKHCETLKDFALNVLEDGPWNISEGYLGQLALCKKLSRLFLAYYTRPRHGSIRMLSLHQASLVGYLSLAIGIVADLPQGAIFSSLVQHNPGLRKLTVLFGHEFTPYGGRSLPTFAFE